MAGHSSSEYASIDGVRFFDTMSYFQDGGHDVLPPLADVSVSCPLAHRTHVTSVAHCMCVLHFLIHSTLCTCCLTRPFSEVTPT